MSDLEHTEPPEDDEKRRRWILWFFLALIVVVILVLSRCNRAETEQSVAEPATTTTTEAPAATTPPASSTTAASTTTTTLADPSVDGVWTMIVNVATGACGGEEEFTHTVTIRQDGNTFTIVGLGFPAEEQVWAGEIDGNTITFGRDREEDYGVTTATFTLEVDFETMAMSGIEEWDWNGPGGSCPGNESIVTATRSGE